ncbi:hypothetical protein IU450_38635 [Nocardia abscessus]|uniref:hypothetical protein n=1 Tax=Nocardia abscessus TaxID=120957 RepID=UPI001895DA72|nr:hypothetical protein [Nocardia abscessus]MBF6341754.1 hypothetical protein [Nocardia abscessus]
MTGHRLSPRDMNAVTILAEMYGAPMDQVARLLGGVSIKSAYRAASKWRKAHLVSDQRIRPVPGPTWVFPTRRSVEELLPYGVRYWRPSPKMADHVRTVLDLRLALVGTDLNRWISEREMRAEVGVVKAGEPRPHIHDGRFYDDQGRLWAVEVELTAKNEAAAKIAVLKSMQVAAQADCAGLVYYCRGEAVLKVVRGAALAATAAVPELVVRVADIDQVLKPEKDGAGAESRPGLTVIEGGASDHTGQAAHGVAGKAVSR